MRTVLIYSGGIDSTVLLYRLLGDGDYVQALSVNYGQRHQRELKSAKEICEKLNVVHQIADLSSIRSLLGGSSQTDSSISVPYGHYAEESMKKTVVPNRNMIMLAVATGWAIASECDRVAYAAHAGDHAIYPDCRPQFAEALDRAVQLADWREMRIVRPFIQWTKAQIIAEGHALRVPFDLTWSCYEGNKIHCGKCGTCYERREAFQLANVPDPTTYEP